MARAPAAAPAGAWLRARGWSWRTFFPVAALYAALAVPLSLQAMTTAQPWLPALASPLAHARELLGGFALAVIAGYLLGAAPGWQRWALLVLWAGARAAWLLSPGSAAAMAWQAATGALFIALLVPKFVGRGRRLRNLSVAPLLLALGAAPTVFDLSPALPGAGPGPVLVAWVVLHGWLMAFMGGRLIAPAAAGARHAQGEQLGPRVQPAMEAAIIGTLGAAVVTAAVPSWWPLCGALLVAAALLLAVRLVRWQLWRCRGRLDLWCLGIGYGWLAAGSGLLGVTLIAGASPFSWLHGITVGALGTLTLNVMLRTRLMRTGAASIEHPLLPMGTALIAVAAVARLAASALPAHAAGLLWVAAAAWSLAFVRLTGALASGARAG